MNLSEYESVKGLTYLEYCDYLQDKYGLPQGNYFLTNSCNSPNTKIKRTKDGLFLHHKCEDRAVDLSKKGMASLFPFEWQMPKNLVYCDYLEHLYLHILICEYPSQEKEENHIVGIGGVINHFIPILNDIFSGWESVKTPECSLKIKKDKPVYLQLLKRFWGKNYNFFSEEILFKSCNTEYGTWDIENNIELFNEIVRTIKL